MHDVLTVAALGLTPYRDGLALQEARFAPRTYLRLGDAALCCSLDVEPGDRRAGADGVDADVLRGVVVRHGAG